jgi:hypothetical protein
VRRRSGDFEHKSTAARDERLAVAVLAELVVAALEVVAELLAVQWSPRSPSCGTSAASRTSPLRQHEAAPRRPALRAIAVDGCGHVGHEVQASTFDVGPWR